MTFINSYRPPSPQTPVDLYGPNPYDLNFCLSTPTELKTPSLRLIPLVPRAHADAIWLSGGSDQSLYRHILFPMRTKDEFLKVLGACQKETGRMLWLIVDMTKEEDPAEAEGPGRGGRGSLGGRIAGWLGYVEVNPTHKKAMIGPVIILPSAQRSHVTTHAVGLLLQYALNLPSDPMLPGLGLRRVEWAAESGNIRSIATAKRLGFQMEGTFRWQWILPDTVEENVGQKFERKMVDDEKGGDPAKDVPVGKGRHEVYLSICWDDWERGGRETLRTQMARSL